VSSGTGLWRGDAVADLVALISGCFIASLALVAPLVYLDNEKLLQPNTPSNDAPRREKAN